MEIVPNTTSIQDCDNERGLLAKILHRLNLNSQVQIDAPATNVAVTNTPLAVDFDGTQPVEVQGQAHVLVDNVPASIAVSNFPATQPVSGTINVGNFPASQNVVVTNVPTVVCQGQTFQDGHLSTVNVPLEFEIAHEGNYLENGVEKAAFIYRALGRRAGFNSTSVLQDLGEWLGTGPGALDLLPELNGTENLELVSSSVQDDAAPAGTGTHTVRIHYLTTGYVYAFVDYALNGTTPVPVAEKMLFVYCMEALTGGASEIGIGNIDLRVAGGGAIHERISAGGNRSLSGRFMVPDNYKAYMLGWAAGAVNTTCDFRLRATRASFTVALSSRYIFQSNAFVGAGQSIDRTLVYRPLPARAKVKVSVLPGATVASNRADCEVLFLLVQD